MPEFGSIDQVDDDLLLKEYVRRFTIKAGESISSECEAANHFRGFFSDAKKQEQFVVCFLNGQNQVLITEVLFKGSLTSSAVYPREVIEKVLEYGAAAVLFGHNHPSGSIHPSSSDRMVTQKLQSALEAIDVKVLDHIIIGGIDHFSFAESGLI